MAKASGLAWSVLNVDDAFTNLTGIRSAVSSLDFGTPRAPWDITSIDLSAMERMLLLADFSINIQGQVDDALTYVVFRSVNTGVLRRTNMTVNGSNLNLTGVLYTDCTITRANDAKLTFKAVGMLGDGNVPTWS